MQTTEEQWAYIAGLFDGEGYLAVFKHTSPSFRERLKEGFVREYRVSLSSNSKELLEYVQTLIDGKGKIYEHKRINPKHATGYRLSFYPNTVREIFPHIIPYMYLKKEMTQIILQMLEVTKKIHDIKRRKILLAKLNSDFEIAFKKVTRIIKPNTVLNSDNQNFWENKK